MEILIMNWKSVITLMSVFFNGIYAKNDSVQYNIQVLEPTGGKVKIPKGWFYNESHSGPVYRWTLSKENVAGGKPYQTGMNIQLFSNVKKNTKKTAKAFINDFFASKRNGSKVLSSCNEQNQGLFTRICLETIEGEYHIQYSGFWGTDDLDLAVVTVSGAPIDMWNQYGAVFSTMNEFVLIDMSRFASETAFKNNGEISKSSPKENNGSTITYYPENGVVKDTGRTNLENIRLITTENEISKNFTADNISEIIKKIQKIVSLEFNDSSSEGGMICKITIQKNAAPKLEILQQGDLNPAILNNIYKKITQLEDKSKVSDVSFQMEFSIRKPKN